MEIERKWLFDIDMIKDILKKNKTFNMFQAYLSIEPEVRIRMQLNTFDENVENYELTIKGNGILSREEINKSITREEFESLKKIGGLKDELFINKEVTEMKVGNYTLVVGITDIGKATEFSYGEIEFASEEEANNFIPPSWFGKEVTNDKNYKMKNFYKNTRFKK